MKHQHIRPAGAWVCLAAGVLLSLWILGGCTQRTDSSPLTVVVMDPLAAELACACVGDYAQRDYHALTDYLGNALDRPVTIVFADNLDKATRQLGGDAPVLVIGKESVVRFDAKQSGLTLEPICRLTDTQGRTTLTGLFVVKAHDPAWTLSDLSNRRILLGTADSDEKHVAALKALKVAGVEPPQDLEIRGACSDAAIDVVDSSESLPTAAVISSYALPLLEGCGSIERGSLRVLGETRPVPFISVYFNISVVGARKDNIKSAFLRVCNHPELLEAMESSNGFTPWVATDWPDWRGPNRDGQTAYLPENLPMPIPILWERRMTGPALAGLAANPDVLLTAERDPFDTRDVFRCLNASDGKTLWTLSYEATACLDYGSSPRATPVIAGDKAYLLGALGLLHCVNVTNGSVLWKRHLVKDLDGKQPIWGYSSTPLVVEDTIIVNPGGPVTSLMALNRHTGEILWQTSGAEAAYGSFIAKEFGGRMQIVGYDAISLGGWDFHTGKRLWTLTPSRSGDFNVPTPLEVNGQLLVATENNGTRLYRFRKDGVIVQDPVAWNTDLAPETTSPVVSNGTVVGCGSALRCLDPENELNEVWCAEDIDPGPHASLIVSVDRLLMLTYSGELLLLDNSSSSLHVIARRQILEEGAEIYAHPAVSGGCLFLRDDMRLVCLALE